MAQPLPADQARGKLAEKAGGGGDGDPAWRVGVRGQGLAVEGQGLGVRGKGLKDRG